MNRINRINWVDGMLLNKEHFKGMENFLLSNIYHTNRLFLSKRYGIVNSGDEDNKGHPQFRIIFDSADMKNQKIIIEQIEFMAITPEGSFLEVSAHSFEPGRINKKTFDSNVIVSVEEELINHGVPLYLVLLTQPYHTCLLYTSPSPRDRTRSRMPSSA